MQKVLVHKVLMHIGAPNGDACLVIAIATTINADVGDILAGQCIRRP